MMATISLAQDENLVQNGSFEQVSGKVKKLGAAASATGWLNPTGQPADLYSSAPKVPDISTPENFNGTEEAAEGKNYAGIVAYSYNDKEPRSYLMTKLVSPLKKGSKYCVSFKASLAETSKYAIDCIGAKFTSKSYETEAKSSLIDATDIQLKDKKALTGMYGWDNICGVFTAKGGEKYITIGNFYNNNQVIMEKMRKVKYFKGTQRIVAYYYIDDVSVKLVDDASKCDCSSNKEEDSYSKLVYQKVTTITDKMTPQQKIEANILYFAFGKYQLTSEGKASLDEIAKMMKASSMTLDIQGHLDDQEAEKAAENPTFQELGEARAEAVKEYLVEKGVSAARITSAVDKSNTVPSNETSEADNDELKAAKTRRVTFIAK
jgi:outer membrane protein OmpA-like peptidoglycan-associated protein